VTYVVRLLRSSERDIAAGIAWYRAQEPGLGREFLAEVDDTMKRIAKRSTSHAKRLQEYRAAHVQRFPYIVYFRIVANEIRISAVLHHRRGKRARDSRLRAKT
jgi:plasmid stabilization system protein ParE